MKIKQFGLLGLLISAGIVFAAREGEFEPVLDTIPEVDESIEDGDAVNRPRKRNNPFLVNPVDSGDRLLAPVGTNNPSLVVTPFPSDPNSPVAVHSSALTTADDVDLVNALDSSSITAQKKTISPLKKYIADNKQQFFQIVAKSGLSPELQKKVMGGRDYIQLVKQMEQLTTDYINADPQSDAADSSRYEKELVVLQQKVKSVVGDQLITQATNQVLAQVKQLGSTLDATQAFALTGALRNVVDAYIVDKDAISENLQTAIARAEDVTLVPVRVGYADKAKAVLAQDVLAQAVEIGKTLQASKSTLQTITKLLEEVTGSSEYSSQNREFGQYLNAYNQALESTRLVSFDAYKNDQTQAQLDVQLAKYKQQALDAINQLVLKVYLAKPGITAGVFGSGVTDAQIVQARTLLPVNQALLVSVGGKKPSVIDLIELRIAVENNKQALLLISKVFALAKVTFEDIEKNLQKQKEEQLLAQRVENDKKKLTQGKKVRLDLDELNDLLTGSSLMLESLQSDYPSKLFSYYGLKQQLEAFNTQAEAALQVHSELPSVGQDVVLKVLNDYFTQYETTQITKQQLQQNIARLKRQFGIQFADVFDVKVMNNRITVAQKANKSFAKQVASVVKQQKKFTTFINDYLKTLYEGKVTLSKEDQKTLDSVVMQLKPVITGLGYSVPRTLKALWDATQRVQQLVECNRVADQIAQQKMLSLGDFDLSVGRKILLQAQKAVQGLKDKFSQNKTERTSQQKIVDQLEKSINELSSIIIKKQNLMVTDINNKINSQLVVTETMVNLVKAQQILAEAQAVLKELSEPFKSGVENSINRLIVKIANATRQQTIDSKVPLAQMVAGMKKVTGVHVDQDQVLTLNDLLYSVKNKGILNNLDIIKLIDKVGQASDNNTKLESIRRLTADDLKKCVIYFVLAAAGDSAQVATEAQFTQLMNTLDALPEEYTLTPLLIRQVSFIIEGLNQGKNAGDISIAAQAKNITQNTLIDNKYFGDLVIAVRKTFSIKK